MSRFPQAHENDTCLTDYVGKYPITRERVAPSDKSTLRLPILPSLSSNECSIAYKCGYERLTDTNRP